MHGFIQSFIQLFIFYFVDFTDHSPVNYLPDDVSESNSQHLDEDVRRMNLNDSLNSRSGGHIPPSPTPSQEKPPHSPIRGEHFRQLSTQPVRYSFADSEDEENEDPIAWALASRSGKGMDTSHVVGVRQKCAV